MELEHAHAILRKLGAEGPDGFLKEEASVAWELARAVERPSRTRVHADTLSHPST